MKNCNKVKIVLKKQNGFLNLIRVTRLDEILNIKLNTNKKTEQILKQSEKKGKLQRLLYKSF